MSKFDSLFHNQELTSVKVHLSKVRERETMDGQYILSNGKKVKGVSYNNSDLSGTLEFFNNDDEPSSEEFLQAFSQNNWVIFVEQGIDKFQGPGRSIDYEYEDFIEFIEGNSAGCEYEAGIEPDYLIFNFEGNQEKIIFIGDGNYKYKNEVIKKVTLLETLSKFIDVESPEVSITLSNTVTPVDLDSLFSDEKIRQLKSIFEKMLSDVDIEITEFESTIISNRSVVIFPQEDPQALSDAEKFIIRLEERIYKKNEIKSSSTIAKFNIPYSNKNEDLVEFKKALATYIQIGGSSLDLKT